MARDNWMAEIPLALSHLADIWKEACLAQHQKDIEELEKPCGHLPEFTMIDYPTPRRQCSICWGYWKEETDG